MATQQWRRAIVRYARVLVCMLLLVATADSAVAQSSEPYQVPRLTGTIQLDGRSDEPAWQAIEPLRAVGSFPAFGAEPSERTEFRMAYDDEYLYFAARLYDSDVRGIRATSLRRDESSFSNEVCGSRCATGRW